MDRDVMLVLIGAGIAMVSSILTALFSELLKFIIEKRNRRDSTRRKAIEVIGKLSAKILLNVPDSAFDLEEFVEMDQSKSIDSMDELELVRIMGVLETLNNESEFQLFISMIQSGTFDKNKLR